MSFPLFAEFCICALSLLLGFQSSRLHYRFSGLPTILFATGAALKYRYFLQTASRLHLCVSFGAYILAYLVGNALVCIGLTGGIACGKSSVVEVIRTSFPEVLIIDCDKIVRDLQRPGKPVFSQLVAAFGPSILTAEGELNRPKLAKIIFSDETARRKINAITHPAVSKAIVWKLICGRMRGYRYVLLDAPLLFETKVFPYFCHPIITITVTDKSLWLQRLMARDGISEEEALAKIKAQMPVEEKARRSNFVIDNKGDFSELQLSVHRTMSHVLGHR